MNILDVSNTMRCNTIAAFYTDQLTVNDNMTITGALVVGTTSVLNAINTIL